MTDQLEKDFMKMLVGILLIVGFSQNLFAAIPRSACRLEALSGKSGSETQVIKGSRLTGKRALETKKNLVASPGTRVQMVRDYVGDLIEIASSEAQVGKSVDGTYPESGCQSTVKISTVCQNDIKENLIKCVDLCQYEISCIDHR